MFSLIPPLIYLKDLRDSPFRMKGVGLMLHLTRLLGGLGSIDIHISMMGIDLVMPGSFLYFVSIGLEWDLQNPSFSPRLLRLPYSLKFSFPIPFFPRGLI
jgi:hypothetical protein